ncbi:beta strand repeat-containing protein [Chitinophagaceae bacterium MMS25-I14]
MKLQTAKLFIAIPLLLPAVLKAQQRIGDGTANATINAAAILELQSTNKGFLPSRVALTDRFTWAPISGTPTKGMVVYNTTASGTNGLDTGLVVWEGAWNPLSNASQADYWRLKGNTGTNPGTALVGNAADGNFWGTTDAKNLVVATNGVKRMMFDTSGNAWGGKNNTIVNAATQNLDDGTYPATSFMWGTNNTDSSFLNTVFGTKNLITGHLHSNIIAGEKDTIGGSWGWGNAVFGVNNSLTVQNGGGNIVGGIQNRRVGTANASGNGGVLFGFQNIDSSYFSSLVGGSNNTLGPGAGNSFVGGELNKISTPFFTGWGHGIAHDNTIFGSWNTILSKTSSSTAATNFVSGTGNALYDANVTGIIAGSADTSINSNAVTMMGWNNADSASTSSLIGGEKNRAKKTYRVLMMGSNLTANSTQQSALFGNGNGDQSSSNILISGDLNTTGNSADLLVAGGSNTISRTYASAVFGLNNIDSLSNSNLISGNGNISNTLGNSIVGGAANKLYHTTGIIMGGYQNSDSSSNILLVSGYQNRTNTATGGTIVSGTQNSVYHTNAAAVFGNNNIDSVGNTLVSGMGNTVTSTMPEAAVVGRYNKPAYATLFAVGNGTSAAVQSNAVTVANTPAAATATANNSTLNVNGSVSGAIQTVTGNYTLTDKDYTVIFHIGSANATFTLPDPTTCKGRIYHLVNGDENNHQINLNYPVYLFGGGSYTSMTIGNGSISAGSGVGDYNVGNTGTIQSDGTQWWRIGL